MQHQRHQNEPLFSFSVVVHLSDGVYDVVDLEYGPDALAGQGDGGGGHQQGLDHVLLQDVGDGALADVDAGALVALGVPGEANSVLANIHVKKINRVGRSVLVNFPKLIFINPQILTFITEAQLKIPQT